MEEMNTQEIKTKKSKKWYQRWWVWLLIIIAAFIAIGQIRNTIEQAQIKEIPNVMSINYADAEKVLSEKGFTVTSIETDASSILSNNKLYNRSVKKGEVFKINDRVSPDYVGQTKDRNITIYYAKDDYTYEKPAETEKPVPTSASQTNKTIESEKIEGSTAAWKQFLKDYEAWFDKYIDILKKYKRNPTDASILSDYSKMVSEMTEWSERAKQYQDELSKDPNASEMLKEYMDTLARITKKASELQ